MPIQPTYPGVYIEEIPSGVRTITGVATSIAAFIGYFKRGPMDKAVQIFNWGDFEREFGGLHSQSEASYAIQQFFLNGGTQAYVVRVASGNSTAAAVEISDDVPAGGSVLTIKAIHEGIWGNNIRVKIDHDTPVDGEFNMIVTEYDDSGTKPVRQEKFLNLSMDISLNNHVDKVINDDNTGSAIVRVEAIGASAPAASGTVSGEHDSPITIGSKLNVTINDQTESVDLKAETYPLNDLALMLENAIRSAAPANSQFAGVAVNVVGNNLHILAGPGAPESIVSFANAGGDDTADTLKLTNGANANMQEYILGTNEMALMHIAHIVFEPWDPTGEYEKGNIIKENSSLYTCVAQDKYTAKTFEAEVGNWEEITVEEWDGSNVSYKVGNVIKVTDPPNATTYYRCQEDHNSSVGTFNPGSIWSEIEVDTWNVNATTYRKDDVIKSDPLYYICKTEEYTSGTFDAELKAGNWEEIDLAPTAVATAQLAGTEGKDGERPNGKALIGSENDKTGLYALEDVDLFNILCIPRTAMTSGPNAMSADEAFNVMSAAEAYCGKRRAFFIIDTPVGIDNLQGIKGWINSNPQKVPRSKNAAVFYPRVKIPDSSNNYRPRSLGASGTLAGLFARIDANRGIWKAPAGTETGLRNVSELTYILTDQETGVLNQLGVNCLRNFSVYGNICWGARTLEGAEVMASEWKYIPVRRLALFIEESLYRGTKWVVFEPNDEPLWAQIRLNIGAFMNNLFKRGAFQGTNPKDAYLVKCDKETTTQNDINRGIVNILVGFAPLKPAEFVFIKIQQLAGQVQS